MPLIGRLYEWRQRLAERIGADVVRLSDEGDQVRAYYDQTVAYGETRAEALEGIAQAEKFKQFFRGEREMPHLEVAGECADDEMSE